MENSKIEWTHHTFNPWIGCTKISDGCKNCYAENLMDKRMGRVQWGPQGTRERTSEAYWKKPLAWNRKLEGTGRRERVFCASLADVFEDRPGLDEWRADLFRLIQQTPNLDWLLLTKRPDKALDWLNMMYQDEQAAVHFFDDDYDFLEWLWENHNTNNPISNVWIGTSVENQEQADKRIPELLDVPAKVRFLSCEPLLGPVNLSGYLNPYFAADDPRHHPHRNGIDWIIVGGESGTGARRFDLSWAYSIKHQCEQASVPFFMKQLGTMPTSVQWGYTIRDKKGGNWYEWPEDLRIREMPQLERA